ncbi:Patellin-3 [Apostasia shenzhenica]|uniref:Patellin-3 n=1 Tax=Apostasia shenzhenica TaxID=1088818 RepID=A0A2H9ZXH7_9ASPA|nr:Patellin-3 [Apostasia shenzhenica]
MAEKTQVKVPEAAPAEGFVVVEAKTEEKIAPEETKKPAEEEQIEEKESVVQGVAIAAGGEAAIQQSVSFKEESNLVADLQEPEKKALDELKQLIHAALANDEFNPPPRPPPPTAPAAKSEASKVDESKVDEPTAAATEGTPAGTNVEEPLPESSKAEEQTAAAAKEEAEAEEPAIPAVPGSPKSEGPVEALLATETNSVVVDEDGAKTVEAIEETVVPVAPPASAPEEVIPAAEAEKDKETVAEEKTPASPAEEVFIWGVPLLGDEKSDSALLKFLRARDFKVKDAFVMIKNAVIWRKMFGIESLLEEDLAMPELEKVVFYRGHDKEGHPVCYNVYGEFQDQELYSKAFGDEKKREKFLRWRIQLLEKGIRQRLGFSPAGICSMVQVTDLKNVLGPGKRELRQATKKALALLQDNYPEFVAKQVIINVPWWYLAYNRMMSPFFTQRSKSKFAFAGPSKSAEILFKYIAPEQVPVQYGGLGKDNDPDFTTSNAVNEVTIKPSGNHIIVIPATESCLLVWELRVLGWEVSYSAEFIPTAEEAYTVLVQKARKFTPTDEPYIKNIFKAGEPGKIVLTIENATTKKKKLLYRSKTKTSSDQ